MPRNMNALQSLGSPRWNKIRFVPRSGEPLPYEFRRRAEELLGEDLSEVRVFVEPEATRLGVRAFTSGTRIYVSPRELAQGPEHWLHLLGHELAHVIQQRRGLARNPHGYGLAAVRDPALEQEAERMGARIQCALAPVRKDAGAIQPAFLADLFDSLFGSSSSEDSPSEPVTQAVEIPKRIHIIWMGSILEAAYLVRCIIWKKRNPGHEVVLWTNRSYSGTDEGTILARAGVGVESVTSMFLPSEVLDLMAPADENGSPNYGAASDAIRLILLSTRGGIYVDTDDVVGAPLPSRLLAPRGVLLGGDSVTNKAGHWVLSNDILAADSQNEQIKATYRDVMDSLEGKGRLSKQEVLKALRSTDIEERKPATENLTGPLAMRKTMRFGGRTLDEICLDAYDGNEDARAVVNQLRFPLTYVSRRQANDWLPRGKKPPKQRIGCTDEEAFYQYIAWYVVEQNPEATFLDELSLLRDRLGLPFKLSVIEELIADLREHQK